MRFIRSTSTLSEGGTYNGRSITSLYTGFENSTNVPAWSGYTDEIYSVVFEDYIYPISTSRWFQDFRNINSIDLTKLNVSNVTDMSYMFRYAGYDAPSGDFTITGLSGWNTSRVTNMSYMFYYAANRVNTWNIDGITGWDVSNVTNMNYMFYNAARSITSKTYNLSSWNVCRVTSYTNFENTLGITTQPSWGMSC